MRSSERPSLSKAIGTLPHQGPPPRPRSPAVGRPKPPTVGRPASSAPETAERAANDARAAARSRQQRGTEDSPDFLPTLTEAPDFDTAAAFVVAQLARLAGATRGFVSIVDAATDSLVLAAQSGLDGKADEVRAISLAELAHPLVAVTLAMQPAQGNPQRGSASARIPFSPWIALPLPQPLVRGAPAPLAPHHAAERLAAHGAKLLASERRLGQVPAGVVVLEARGLAPEAISRLVRLAALAGPVLSLRAELDASRREADRLRHERDRLTIMMDALPDPVLITDGANNILVQNHRAEHLLTARDADSPGRHRALELNNLLFTSGLARAVMSGGARTEPRELNLVDPDEGADLLFELLAHPLTGDAERDGAVLSVLRDVTDLRRAAHELQHQIQRVRRAEIDARKERDRLNLILENVADPILVTDSQAKIILMNEQAEQLFEIGGEAASYAPAAQQAVQRNDTKFTTFVSEFALSDDASRHERMTLDRPLEGNELPVEVVSGKIHNERGEPVAIVSVLHDLTKQVENERLYRELKAFSDELEARVRAATADLAAQNEQLKWQSQEVERANKLKSEFMASMSHELRTPINAIIGHSSLILDEIYGPVAPRQEDALRRIRAAAQDLLALITDILDLAKIEAGKMSLHLDRVDLGDVLAELGQQIEPMLQKRGLEFQVSVAPDTPTLATDRQKVKQILANLLSNAVKFTQRGRVTVTVEPVPGAVQIAVADTGIGILPEDLDVIWEDFRQVDQSKTREVGGTGLGLSIVRKLLDRLDGTVSVTSTYGVGSVFTVVLPLAMRVEEAGETFAPA